MQVVSDLQKGRFPSCYAAEKAHGITGKGTVQRWVRQYGFNQLLRKVVRVQATNEPSELQRLKAENARLQKFALETAMDRDLIRATYLLLCEQQGVDAAAFEKKLAASSSCESSTPTKGGRK
jgi:hypothetical protein